MRQNLDIAAPTGLVFGWLAGVAGFALGLLAAVTGQAIGGLIGGCGWIGVATPIWRQVWALVNQPALNFASQPRAVGYWLGSTALPLLVALTVIHLVPRARTLGSELLAAHVAWGAAVVGLAWLPLVDAIDGHLARFLDLNDLPSIVVWLAPVIAATAGVLPTLRLLALARVARIHAGRGLRVMLVLVQLGVPCVGWVALATVANGGPMVAPSLAAFVPLLIACGVAWIGYPPPFVHRLREIETTSWVRITGLVIVLVVVLWFTGRPMANGRSAGLLWGTPGAYNNVRPWIEAAGVSQQRPSARPADAGAQSNGSGPGQL